MRLYRIAAERYARDLSGTGAYQNGGRWTPPGHHAIYAAEHPALAAYEKLVHLGAAVANAPLGYALVSLDIPDTPVTTITHVPNDPQRIGRQWLTEGKTLALCVPSVVVALSWNYVINPDHGDMAAVTLAYHGTFPFDSRA